MTNPTPEALAEPTEAIRQLREHQRQLDMDGVIVGVSRQAIDEVLAYVEALRSRPEPRQPDKMHAARRVEELRMTPFSESAPVRDELMGEQTILTYSEAVGVWGLEFFESGWEFPDRWIGGSHWIDITSMWPGVTAQVTEFDNASHPTSEPLPDVLPGHWDTPGGLEMAKRSLAETRAQLCKGDVPDLALANAIYLANRHDLDLIVWQQAAKERIRWLSAHLAAALSKPINEPLPDAVERALAKADGLDWDETCALECPHTPGVDSCDSSTCVAALDEDHDPDAARDFYRKRARAALSAMPASSGEVGRYRHKKRGTVYTVIGAAELQMTFDLLCDGAAMIVYRGEDGKLWVRDENEFHDGRFERVDDHRGTDGSAEG